MGAIITSSGNIINVNYNGISEDYVKMAVNSVTACSVRLRTNDGGIFIKLGDEIIFTHWARIDNVNGLTATSNEELYDLLVTLL